MRERVIEIFGLPNFDAIKTQEPGQPARKTSGKDKCTRGLLHKVHCLLYSNPFLCLPKIKSRAAESAASPINFRFGGKHCRDLTSSGPFFMAGPSVSSRRNYLIRSKPLFFPIPSLCYSLGVVCSCTTHRKKRGSWFFFCPVYGKAYGSTHIFLHPTPPSPHISLLLCCCCSRSLEVVGSCQICD